MEYPKRETLEKELYANLKKGLRGCYEGLFEVKKEEEGEVLIRELYLEPQKGCVPEEFIGEELLYAIKSKYYQFFEAIRVKLQAEYLEKKKVHHPWISILVDPTFEDTTWVLVMFQKAVLFEHQSKAWNFAWGSVAELQKEMADIYYEMRDRLNEYFLEGIRYQKEKTPDLL